MNRACWSVGVVVLVSAMTGCVAESPQPNDAGTDASTMDFSGGLLTYDVETDASGSNFGMTARTSGELSVVDGCVIVGDQLAAFPSEATWDGTTLSLFDNEVSAGDHITLDGGAVSDFALPSDIPEDCRRSSIFFVSGLDDGS
jgi:hypothetical protein